ncbi:MAG: histone deacetylase [Polyangiales bacterium]
MARWHQRRTAHRRLRDQVGLWYHPQYKVDVLVETARVPGIEVARGEKILGSLGAEGLLRPKQVRPAPLAALSELARAHTEAYLDQTARPQYLGRIFGLEAHDIDVDPVLVAQRRQVGATVEAARWAIQRKDRVAFNLGGGFHHAEPESGSGFCVYNDIAVAIASLRSDGFDAPIAIVDLDYHQGNGNIVTYEDDTTVFTYSIHGSVWSHVEAAADEQFLLPSKVDDETYLKKLHESLPPSLERIEPGLIFYIAGTDVLRGDHLGDFMLTRQGVLERDRFVIELARKHECPAVVTLGGGYSGDAWRASTDFIRWLLIDEARVSEEPSQSIYEQYAQIAKELDPYELQRGSGTWQLTEADLMGDLAGSRYKSTRLLDYYSRHGIEFALEKYGLADRLRKLGFTDLALKVDPSDPDRQHLTLRARKGGEEHLLVDQVLRRVSRPAPEGLEPPDELRFLYIEWMMLQNPTANFSLRQPQWPGQDHPGLGVGEEAMHMLFQGAQRLELDALAHHPSHYHIAFIGGGQSFFLDPEIQGRFEAIREVLAPMDLSEAAWKMERGEVCWSDGEPVEWIPEDMVIPASERLFAYLGSVHYQRPRAAALERARERGIVLEPTLRKT